MTFIPVGSGGSFQLSIAVPAIHTLVGASIHHQALHLDAAAGSATLSQGITATYAAASP
ncbi:MAG: hypothetical protein AAF628_36765 [Planctomycetota bacterium]